MYKRATKCKKKTRNVLPSKLQHVKFFFKYQNFDLKKSKTIHRRKKMIK